MNLKAGQWVKCVKTTTGIEVANEFILELNRYYKIVEIRLPDFEIPDKLGGLYFPKSFGIMWITIQDEYTTELLNKFAFPIIMKPFGDILESETIQYFDLDNPLDYNPDEVV